ncbi:MAG: glycosyltransferase [Anaerostipes sp.]|nr:glycosyltransferase [Anaerostipes sp.]
MKLSKKAIVKQLRLNYYIKCYQSLLLQENTIFVESKAGKDFGSNMFYLLLELQKKEYEKFTIYLEYVKGKKDFFQNMLKRYQLGKVKLVKRGSRKYYQLLASSKYLMNDTSFEINYIKKDGQVILNSWHGTPLKKMGRHMETTTFSYGNVQKNLIMADYFLTPSDYTSDIMIRSYGADNLSKGKILNSGYPRNSIFFDHTKEESTRKELGYEGKRVYVYMPTWRGSLHAKNSVKLTDQLDYYFQYLDVHMNENDLLLVRLHPFVSEGVDLSKYRHIEPFPKGYEPYEVLNAADCLITDYSSIFFDFANTGKKIILFGYDNELYLRDRGLYISLDDLPFPFVRNEKTLLEEMHTDKNYDDTEFRNTYCMYDVADTAQKICKTVFLGGDECQWKSYPNNGKENVLIYVGSMPMNGLTSSILNLFSNIDLKKRNYYACFRSRTVRKNPHRIEQLPEAVGLVPMPGNIRKTTMEDICKSLYYEHNKQYNWILKRMKRWYDREAKRFFAAYQYEDTIQFTGYEKEMIHLFGHMKGKKIIFAHNDMIQEMGTRGNQHELTLRWAYTNYNKVAAVTEDIFPTLFEIGATNKNATVVNNCIDYDGIKVNGSKQLVFDSKTKCDLSEEELEHILDSDAKIMITIGRYSPEKGHMMLLDAFEKYYKEHPNTYLIIIGGHGCLYPDTKVKRKGMLAMDHVILIKALSNPMPILKRSDLFILSSVYEGLGLVLLEAVIQGVPVISTNIQGPRGFMIQHGGTLVNPDVQGIYEGMQKFYRGELKPLEVDFEAYNKKSIEEFENLF